MTFMGKVADAPAQQTKKAKKRDRDVQKAKDMVHDPVQLFTRPFATEHPKAAAKARAVIEGTGAAEVAKVAAEAKKAKKDDAGSTRRAKDALAKKLGDFMAGAEECSVEMGECTIDSLIDSLPQQQQSLFDAAEVRNGLRLGETASGVDSFDAVCKRMGMPSEIFACYREWLLREDRPGVPFM